MISWRGVFTQNLGWKALSLGTALVLWWLVSSEPEIATYATVRLEYQNLPEGLEVSSEPVGSVTLELRGPSGELRNVGNGGLHPAVVLDMSAATPGEHTFTISDKNVQLTRGIHLVRAIPSEVRVDFETHASREIPVTVRFEGSPKGYALASFSVDPDRLLVVGPASHVQRIRSLITDPVDLSHVVGQQEFRVNAFVDDAYVRFETSPQVTVRVTMRKE